MPQPGVIRGISAYKKLTVRGEHMGLWKIAPLALALSVATSSFAQTTTLVPIAGFPESTDTVAFAINDTGVITGSVDTTIHTGTHTPNLVKEFSFYGPAAGPYQSFSVNGFSSVTDGTQARGINNKGDIVGFFHSPTCPSNGYLNPPAAGQTIGCQGFVRYSASASPQAITDANGTPMVAMVTGINYAGTFVGNYCRCSHSQQLSKSIAFYGTGGKVQTKIDLSFLGSVIQARARGINQGGDIVGFLTVSNPDGSASLNAFLLKKQQVYVLNFPQAGANTTAEAINDSGNITGSWTDANGVSHGFWLSADLVHWRSFDLPGESQNTNGGTEGWGLNNANQFLLDGDGDPKFPVSFVVCPFELHPGLTGACSSRALASKGVITITPLAVTGPAPAGHSCPFPFKGHGPDCFSPADLVPAN